MSWTIRELKTRGLAAFKANYWPCVAIALLAFFLLANGGGCRYSRTIGHHGGSSSSAVVASEEAESPSSEVAVESCTDSGDTAVSVPSSDSKWLGKDGKYRKEHPRRFALLVSVAVLAVFAVIAVAVAIRFLVFNPLLVGCRNFFLQNTACKADFNAVGAPFRSWKRVAKTMFLRDLFLCFWFLPAFAVWFVAAGAFLHTAVSLNGEEPLPVGVFLAWAAASALLFVPAIVKTYAYRLVPYLLADDPALSGRAAVTRSRELMAGNKGKAFLLDLSFLGWHLLSLLTLGLLAVFRVLPWLYATDAELYRALVPRPLPPPLPPAAGEGRPPQRG